MKNWIETKGSPFILLDKKHANKWNGLVSDYEIACCVKEYAGVIQMADYNAVILGDEPFPLKMVTRNNEIILFRWVYAPDHKTVDSMIEIVDLDAMPIIEDFSIKWDSKELVLFDAVDTYSDAAKIITLLLVNENCSLKTFQYKEGDIFLIIHRLSPNYP